MLFAPFFSGAARVAVSASPVFGSNAGAASSGSVTSSSGPSLSVEGGSGSFTYLWTRSGAGSFVISDDTAQNPTWTGTVDDGVDETETWNVEVTDAATGAKATTFTTVYLSWFDTGAP